MASASASSVAEKPHQPRKYNFSKREYGKKVKEIVIQLKYLCDIQNEVLKLVARHIVNEITSELQSTPFFSLMVDETTDISYKEDVVFCYR